MDSSYISMEPTKNRYSAQIDATYQIMIDRLKACGINPKHHVLDNECSEEFKEAIRVNKMTYQLVPADDKHRRTGRPNSEEPRHFSTVRLRSQFSIAFVGPSNPADGDKVEPAAAIAHHRQDLGVRPPLWPL